MYHVPNFPTFEGAVQSIDVGLAQQLLVEAGFSAGFTGLCISAVDAENIGIANAMVLHLAAVGIEATVNGPLCTAGRLSVVDLEDFVDVVISLPQVSITSPANLSLFNTSPISVTGTVSESVVAVEVNGIPATLGPGTFVAEVPLVEGTNTITAVARDAAGNVATDSIQVDLVTIVLPQVSIGSPANLSLFNTSPISVSGTVSESAVAVEVNGISATLGPGTFAAEVPLVEGTNTITAAARDAEGNVGTDSIQVALGTPGYHCGLRRRPRRCHHPGILH